MNGAAAQYEADKILAHHHRALIQDGVTWTYADLAVIVASTAVTLAEYGVRPGDRVMIVSENNLALAAILFAASEIDAWSVMVNRPQAAVRDHRAGRVAGRFDRENPEASPR